MKNAKPGQISSLAACLIAGVATAATAADISRRTAVPFVVDPFAISEEARLVVGRASSSDWLQFSDAQPRSQLAYYSFKRTCRRNVICQGTDEVLCDMTTFGKPGVIDGKPTILSEITTSRACERTADLKRAHASMHDSLVFEDIEQFDGSASRPMPKFPPPSLTFP